MDLVAVQVQVRMLINICSSNPCLGKAKWYLSKQMHFCITSFVSKKIERNWNVLVFSNYLHSSLCLWIFIYFIFILPQSPWHSVVEKDNTFKYITTNAIIIKSIAVNPPKAKWHIASLWHFLPNYKNHLKRFLLYLASWRSKELKWILPLRKIIPKHENLDRKHLLINIS